MIDATATPVLTGALSEEAMDGYAQASGMPRSSPGYGYIELVPQRVQMWKGPSEFAGRTLMRAGVWLDHPVD